MRPPLARRAPVEDLVAETVLADGPARLVTRARRPGHPPVVVKATPAGAGWVERAVLRREARLLQRVQGPGVVELVDLSDRGGRTALVLGFVPAGRLADRDVEARQALAPLVEAAIARLHQAGIAHGALTPDHVLVDAEGRPVLVGFGHAHPLGDDGTADRAALGRLLGGDGQLRQPAGAQDLRRSSRGS